MLPAQGIQVKFARSDRPEDIAAEIDADTRAIFCESIGNPAGNIADLAGLAAVAHAHGVPLIVDNTVATPMLTKPFAFGAHIVVHSLTKYMGGHGNSLGGIIVDSGTFPWAQHAAKFPMMTTPEPSYHGVVYTEAMGPAAYIGRARTVPLRNTGSALSPFNAFLLLQGIETLALRMERHCSNALAVAHHLQSHPRVSIVSYAGLPGHPCHALAQKYCAGGLPAIVAHLRGQGGHGRGGALLRRAAAVQAAGQHRRRQVARLPPGLDHAPPDDARGAGPRRRHARHDPALRRHRAYRRYRGGSRAGAWLSPARTMCRSPCRPIAATGPAASTSL
jgi:O-acetylhomoserine (thiol)-lyase